MSYGDYEYYQAYERQKAEEAAAAARARSAAEERRCMAEQEEADSHRRWQEAMEMSNAPVTQRRKLSSEELWRVYVESKTPRLIGCVMLLLFGAFIYWLLQDLLRSFKITNTDAYWYAFFISFAYPFFMICSGFVNAVTRSDIEKRLLEELEEISKLKWTYMQINSKDDGYKRFVTRIAVSKGLTISNPELQDYISSLKAKAA